MVTDFYSIGIDYPGLVTDIIEYFSTSNTLRNKNSERFLIKKRNVLGFLQNYYSDGDSGFMVQPDIINKICSILCDNGCMSKIRTDFSTGLYNNYLVVLGGDFNPEDQSVRMYYNSMVYGFEYIYRRYKDIIVPLIGMTKDGNPTIGTAFKFGNSIITAKHCVTDVTSLMLRGYKADELKKSHILVHENDYVDIAIINLGRDTGEKINLEPGKVLQKVLVMGYPKIPSFLDLVTAEKASIAAKVDLRQTTTDGVITAFGMQYLTKCKMMLISARIAGGNSGGPVINEHGSVVGVVSNTTNGVGDYQDIGYGVVTPIEYLDEINRKQVEYTVNGDFFKEWIE